MSTAHAREGARPPGFDDLLRRLEEVRELSGPGALAGTFDPSDPDAMVRLLGELVDALERSHRRLIESHVQLVSLREVANHTASAADDDETTRTVTRYLARAFGFAHVFLLLVDRDAGRLQGAWTARQGEREATVPLELPLIEEAGTDPTHQPGAIPRTLWLNRAVVHHDARLHPPALLPDGHPLGERLEGIGATVCVPLPRSQAVLPAADTPELCGERCILGDAALLAPPPGVSAREASARRELRQRACLACEWMPTLGVIGIAREAGDPTPAASDLTLLESIALSVAPMLETARLTQDLRRSERFRQHVLDSMASALVVVDMDGRILTFNRAAESQLGVNEDEVRGQPFGQCFGAEGEAVLRGTLEHGREVRREELTLRAHDGTPLPVSLTTSLLRNERRGVYGAIATFVDLTALKRAEEHARQLDRLAALGRFTSSVAHEIRNPLTGIAAGIQYLSRGAPEAGGERENLDFIMHEVRRLDRIVQDLFDITHPRRLQLTAAPLADTVRRATQCLEALLAERELRLALELSARAAPVPHDPDQLEQVVINLVKNAAEASPRGGLVRVRVEPASAAAHGGRAVRLSVSDEGPGVPPEHRKTLFEPFVTTKPGGSGLGLYITHDIVKRHGGRLALSSEPGQGATFTVELPLENHGGNS
ncbi:MAG TPA: ATP-binding protein [Candidatus Eisenbacteria bacterium]|nr:ATP-binding protein [Candidatus Eisenbacteria bacterium]